MSIRRAEILRLRLRCDMTAPQLAREALDQLAEIRPVRDDALLVASELAANAVRHSGTGSSGEIELRAELLPDGIVIAVIDDGGSGKIPRPRPFDARRPGGFGLRIVAAVARRWGSEHLGQTRVWAELAR